MTSKKTLARCDIIIPVWNQLEYTRSCLESLFARTVFPFRVIIIDNASGEETARYLDKIKLQEPSSVTLVRNKENLGFIKATNQGIRQSRAEYVCLLNNDTLLTSGWLTQMVKAVESREDVGIVNPDSNTLGCKPKGRESLEDVARRLKVDTTKWAQMPSAIGFCMLIKREVIEKIGLLDEVFGMGNFDDTDFSRRACNAGYLCVRAKGAYVYHHEKRSFSKIRRFNQDFQRNRQIFFAKWGKIERILYVLGKSNSGAIAKLETESFELSKKGHVVWIFLKKQDKEKIKKISNVSIYVFNELFFNLRCLWRVLIRKKKFDKIYVDDMRFGIWLGKFKFLHKAEIGNDEK